MWRSVATLVLAGIILLGSQINRVFSIFRGLDYLKTATPRFFKFITDPVVQATAIIFGLVIMCLGLYEVWELRKSMGSESRSKKPEFPIHGAFKLAHASHSGGLGEPGNAAETISRAHQSAHQNAMVLWTVKRSSFFILPTDKSRKWEERPDPEWKGMEWCDDNQLRKRFDPPEGLGPPFAGVANRWFQDPPAWEWIGWREWHCGLADISYQKFERGLIIGPFKYNPSNPTGQIFILLDDGSWFSESVAQSGSCIDWWTEFLPAPAPVSHKADPQTPSLKGPAASSIRENLLLAEEGEISVQVRAYRDGIVIAVKQIQNSEKALSARIVVADVRTIKDGKRITSRLLHSSTGRFSYDAIQLQRVSGTEGDLHYGEEAIWWIVTPRGHLQMFWPDRQDRPTIQLPPGEYAAELQIWVGDTSLPVQAAWAIDGEHKATISEIDHT